MKRKTHPTPDDILYGFAVTFDGTPQELTRWQKQYPLWAKELAELALAIALPEGVRPLAEEDEETCPDSDED